VCVHVPVISKVEHLGMGEVYPTLNYSIALQGKRDAKIIDVVHFESNVFLLCMYANGQKKSDGVVLGLIGCFSLLCNIPHQTTREGYDYFRIRISA